MIVAGFGFRAETSLEALRDALTAAMSLRRGSAVQRIATLADKAASLAPLARALGLELVALREDTLTGITVTTHSQASFAARGTGSVAEACALVAAGPGARLLVPRQISSDRTATCALAEGNPA